jgi:hypothetical protein
LHHPCSSNTTLLLDLLIMSWLIPILSTSPFKTSWNWWNQWWIVFMPNVSVYYLKWKGWIWYWFYCFIFVYSYSLYYWLCVGRIGKTWSKIPNCFEVSNEKKKRVDMTRIEYLLFVWLGLLGIHDLNDCLAHTKVLMRMTALSNESCNISAILWQLVIVIWNVEFVKCLVFPLCISLVENMSLNDYLNWAPMHSSLLVVFHSLPFPSLSSPLLLVV